MSDTEQAPVPPTNRRRTRTVVIGTLGALGIAAGAHGPADQAGLAAGDVITAVDGTAITTPDDVSAALADLDPGDPVTVTWTGTTGGSQTATVVLATGPAD